MASIVDTTAKVAGGNVGEETGNTVFVKEGVNVKTGFIVGVGFKLQELRNAKNNIEIL